MENYTAHLSAAIAAALDAGRAIMAIYDAPDTDWGVERKADHSPLTRADREAHAIIAQRLTQATPYPLLSEEGSHAPYADRSGWETLWVVDPLDGTKEFIKRNGEFTVNIALVHEGTPVAGVVYVPATDTLYFGAESFGAYKMDNASAAPSTRWEDLAASSQQMPLATTHEDYVVVVSRSHLSPETEAFIDEARRSHGAVRTVASGSSIKICLVAEGAADAYPRLAPTMEWDTAAGHAIARAAGADIVEAGSGAPLIYNKADLHNPYFIVRRDAKSPQP